METTFSKRDAFVQKSIAAALGSFGGVVLSDAVKAAPTRRAAMRRAVLTSSALTLTRDAQGVLRWNLGTPRPPGPGRDAIARRRGLRRAVLPVTPVLTQHLFDQLPASKIGEWLKGADQKLSRPAWNDKGELWGLRRLSKAGKWLPMSFEDTKKLAGKKVLLIIHGTFSHNDAILSGIKAASNGDAFLSAALTKYDHIIGFDHPTLSQSPMVNAFDLAARLAHGLPASLDIITHSRGGLVTRWFAEGFRHPGLPVRAVLVGAPLAGTSLASPARVRAVMDFLANVGDAVGTVSAMGGGLILTLASTLAGVMSRVTGALATPLADAIIALIPGFAAQSREGQNTELRALRRNTGAYDFSQTGGPLLYSYIRSDFQPQGDEKGVWSFLKTFVKRPGAVLLDSAADAVFESANDLVVDTDSMNETGEFPDHTPATKLVCAHDFGASATVHHTNYFEQPQTLKAVRAVFGF